jgi:hypothetical protein
VTTVVLDAAETRTIVSTPLFEVTGRCQNDVNYYQTTTLTLKQYAWLGDEQGGVELHDPGHSRPNTGVNHARYLLSPFEGAGASYEVEYWSTDQAGNSALELGDVDKCLFVVVVVPHAAASTG